MVKLLLFLVYNSSCSWLVVPFILGGNSSCSQFATPFALVLQLFLVLVRIPLDPSWQLLLLLVSSSSWSWFNSSYSQFATFLTPNQRSPCSWSTVFFAPSSTPFAVGVDARQDGVDGLVPLINHGLSTFEDITHDMFVYLFKVC